MLLDKRIPFSYLFKKIKTDILYVLAVSLLILFITHSYQHLLPDMPLTIPAFIGTAISILLSFKLSQSYDRWWEARKIWGSIVNDSRTLIIQAQTLSENVPNETIKKIAYRQIAWCYSLGRCLRGQKPLDNLDHLVSREEFLRLSEQINPPLGMIHEHANDFKKLRSEGHLHMFSQIQIDETLVRLCDSQGRAERIKSTIFPVTYRLFLHAIIYLFVITLSISLQGVAGIFEIPLLLLIAAAFFFLEKSATHMQDPFQNRPTDTAMTAIARTIEINIRQLIKEDEVPEMMQAEAFYIL